MMRSSATGIVIAVLGILLTLGLALAKSIETPDPESYPRTNQLDLSSDDLSLDTALIKYLLTKDLLSRQRTGFDLDERQRKRSYWKQCAFNAVSCFGKK